VLLDVAKLNYFQSYWLVLVVVSIPPEDSAAEAGPDHLVKAVTVGTDTLFDEAGRGLFWRGALAAVKRGVCLEEGLFLEG
jgi:hypothetical protein